MQSQRLNYANPDYAEIFAARALKLDRLLADPLLLAQVKAHYRTHPWDFVSDWGMTFEPRNIERELLATIPFVLWPKQVEFLQWAYTKWRKRERGLVEKSRDCGVTWLAVGFAVSMWLFVPGFTVGFGSRKEELVDKSGDSKSIFHKVRFFIESLPAVFLPVGYTEKTCCAHMRVLNPENQSSITGEAGDEIGRGGRCSVYIVDEAAFVEHQAKVDAALSQTTNCQIDISTPNGNGNEFYQKRMRWNNTDRIFVFDWRDDPRKDQAWYDKQVEEQTEVTVAQEIDRDYNASAEDSFIPAKWVAASIDAHLRLGFEPSGIRVSGFDPADTGDAKAIVHRYGSVIVQARQMVKGDITNAIPWAFREADEHRADALLYDGDGMGAPTMKVELSHRAAGRMKVIPYHGSGGVADPGISRKKHHEGDKRPVDEFQNFRAQTWTWARERFERTYNAVTRAAKGQVVNIDPDTLISISSQCDELLQLTAELSRPMRIWSANGKIQVESKPHMKARGVASPNLADATVIALSARRAKPQGQTVQGVAHVPSDPGMGY